MRSGVSEIIGEAVLDDGSKGTAYRALRPLVCASCAKPLAAGEMFTRERLPGQSLPLFPRCQECIPFKLEPVKALPPRSPLLSSLLAPADDESQRQHHLPARASTTKEPTAKDEQQRALAAMRERLGPALQRGRRSRFGKR